jgi:hypothetical protein
MAVAFVQEFAIGDRSTTNYDWMAGKLGQGPFDGLIAHSAGFDDEAGVFRLFDIWESQEQAERFIAANLASLEPEDFPNPTTAAEQPSRQGFYELHNVILG